LAIEESGLDASLWKLSLRSKALDGIEQLSFKENLWFLKVQQEVEEDSLSSSPSSQLPQPPTGT